MTKKEIDQKYKLKFGEYPPTFVCSNQEQIDFVYREAEKAISGKRNALTDEEIIGREKNPGIVY